MGSVYNRVRAKVYFLTPEEGGRTRNVDLLHSRSPYVLLADVGLGYTEDGFPLRPLLLSRSHFDPRGMHRGLLSRG